MSHTIATAPTQLHPFVSKLYGWHETHTRTMPWRETQDPYHIWLSEIILQQTQVIQGTAYYERFVREFPTVTDLASANEDIVMRLWQGLGYYSRARNLHTAAKQIASQGGIFPTTYEDILSLKGVGSYSAAAIASFAFGLPHAAIDGNFYRVTARYFGIETPIDTSLGKKVFAKLGEEILDRKNSARFNQAIMDFGATHCRPKSPLCSDCPLADSCVAYSEQRVTELPCKSKRPTISTRHFTFIIPIYNKDSQPHTLLKKWQAGDIWQSLYTPPVIETKSLASHRSISRQLELTSEQAKCLTRFAQGIQHKLTHRLIIADGYLLFCHNETEARTLFSKPSANDAQLYDTPISELDKYGKPRLAERLLAEADLSL